MYKQSYYETIFKIREIFLKSGIPGKSSKSGIFLAKYGDMVSLFKEIPFKLNSLIN